MVTRQILVLMDTYHTSPIAPLLVDSYMVSKRTRRSIAQAYRWIIVGVAGATINELLQLDLPASSPYTWVIVGTVFAVLLAFFSGIDYWIQGGLDPEEEPS